MAKAVMTKRDPLIEDSVELVAAMAAADRLEAAVLGWREDAAAELVRADEIQAGSGAALLDDPDAAPRLAQEISSLRAQSEMKSGAAIESEKRLLDAGREVLVVLAAELRGAAEELHRHAAAHQLRTDELLALLREHEGADYAPDREGNFNGAYRVVATPWSESLRNSAEWLVTTANDLIGASGGAAFSLSDYRGKRKLGVSRLAGVRQSSVRQMDTSTNS